MTSVPGPVDSYQWRQQQWADQFAVDRHVEALHMVGELLVFTMMWRVPDFEAGLVARCATCYAGDREAEAFKQSPRANCPDCYGTTFEGGFRAQIVRPALVDDRSEELEDDVKAVMNHDAIAVETLGSFLMKKGDFIFRGDGKRYQCEQKGEDIIRTGFQTTRTDDSFTGTIPAAHLEDPTAPVYNIPPLTVAGIVALISEVEAARDIWNRPPDYSVFDTIKTNGYL